MAETARVVAGHGRHLLVETDEGRRLICQTRGKGRHGLAEPVVGDRVSWSPAGDGGVVDAVQPRRNLLFRQDEWRTKSFAANLDQLLILVAGEPLFSEEQLTRSLIAANAAGIPTLIGLNKIDLPATAVARDKLRPYRDFGVPVLEVSLKHAADAAQDTLLAALADRVTLILGPSGMGKSTLINRLVPSADAQVGDISQALAAGRHTTTATRWYWLDEHRRGALIDSPGFQLFGLHQIAPESLAALMPDLAAAAAAGCRFHNCSHRLEPGCGVLQALARGEITANRHRLYGILFDELSRRRW